MFVRSLRCLQELPAWLPIWRKLGTTIHRQVELRCRHKSSGTTDTDTPSRHTRSWLRQEYTSHKNRTRSLSKFVLLELETRQALFLLRHRQTPRHRRAVRSKYAQHTSTFSYSTCCTSNFRCRAAKIDAERALYSS